MAITFVDSTTQDSAGALALTFTIPAGATTNDFMVAFVKQSENTGQQTWDDDGGGGNGWTQLAYNRTTGGRDQETAVYWKIHSGSESSPTFTWNTSGTTEPMSGTLLVYRGTDTTTPIQDWGFIEAQNDANPPNAPVDIGADPATIVVFHAATHDDISAVAAPTGYTLRTQVWSGTANDHRNHFTADLIGRSGIGSYTPPDWQHSVLNSTPEYHCYTLALQEPLTIAITDVDTDDKLAVGQTNVVLTGFGFDATQGTGKVELWSDVSGTVKVTQTIDSWSDTSIQFDVVDTGLVEGALYVVVTDDGGDESAPLRIAYGLPDYHTVISDQSPDHWWKFDNNYNDESGTNPFTSSVTGSGGAFSTTTICEQNTHSWRNQRGSRRECANSNFMNGQTEQNRLMGGWIMTGEVDEAFSCIYEEGGGVNNIAFFLGMGNTLIAQMADTADDNVHAFSNVPLEVNRPYHAMFRFSYTDAENTFELYLDGVKQSVTFGNPLTATDLDAHSGDISIGGPGGSLEVFGTDVTFQTTLDMYYANWATWATSRTDAQILELFERGASPDITIDTDTEANMQTDLDTYADTVRPNAPMAIRVQPATGVSDLALDADNITFDPLISIQLEWRGSGTLTWKNLNGSNLTSDKITAPNGGTVTIINPATLTLTGIENDSEVRVYEAGTTNEVGGQESVTTGTFATSVEVSSVDIVVHALGFLNIRLEGIAISGDTSLPIQQRVDRQYENL